MVKVPRIICNKELEGKGKLPQNFIGHYQLMNFNPTRVSPTAMQALIGTMVVIIMKSGSRTGGGLRKFGLTMKSLLRKNGSECHNTGHSRRKSWRLRCGNPRSNGNSVLGTVLSMPIGCRLKDHRAFHIINWVIILQCTTSRWFFHKYRGHLNLVYLAEVLR